MALKRVYSFSAWMKTRALVNLGLQSLEKSGSIETPSPRPLSRHFDIVQKTRPPPP